jgi:hypothetical protein
MQAGLVELGMTIAVLETPKRDAGMQRGMRTLAALEEIHRKQLEELETTQEAEVAAAQLHARYERTAARYKMDYRTGAGGRDGHAEETGASSCSPFHSSSGFIEQVDTLSQTRCSCCSTFGQIWSRRTSAAWMTKSRR